MKVAVAGTGGLAQHIARAIMNQKHEVIILSRFVVSPPAFLGVINGADSRMFKLGSLRVEGEGFCGRSGRL